MIKELFDQEEIGLPSSFFKGTTATMSAPSRKSGYFRPFQSYAHYRSPIGDLYMTGPSCSPGGGISAMGTITVNVMLDDFGFKSKVF